MISYNLFSYLYSYFSENGSLGWDVPTMKQLCTTCVTYKKNGAMESFHCGSDTLQTRTACGSITGYSFNLFTLVLVFPVKLTWMKSILMEAPCTSSNMSRGINSSEPWMMNWLASTSRFTMNIRHVEPIIGWLRVLQSLDSKMSVIIAAQTLASLMAGFGRPMCLSLGLIRAVAGQKLHHQFLRAVSLSLHSQLLRHEHYLSVPSSLLWRLPTTTAQ
jgi:hypothetical protein